MATVASKRKRDGDAAGLPTGATGRPRVDSKRTPERAGGVEQEEPEVDMTILDGLEKDSEPGEALDVRGLKRLVLSFEKKLRDNLAARMKFMDQPERFMESEVELDEEVKKLQVLSTAPELYPELVRLRTVQSIVGLLSHENTDIAVAVVALLNDLTDGDVVGESTEEAELLVDTLVEGNALESLAENLARLDEKDADEAAAVFNTLGIVENMVEVRPAVADLVGERTKLLKWLLARVRVREFDNNKLYASEVLAILVQSSPGNQKRVGQSNGVDTLLQAVAAFKARNPRSSEETELVENLFDALCSAVMPADSKERFVKAEGLELMIIIMKQKRMAYVSAVKVLDFAMTRCPVACERFVDVLGLKTLFAAFMGRVPVKRKSKSEEAALQDEIEERVISIIASLFEGLQKGTRRERLLSKFTEEEHEKVDRIMEFYLRYAGRVEGEERRQAEMRHKGEDDADFQLLALIMAHLWASENKGVRDRIELVLKQQRLSKTDIKGVLEEYQNNLGDIGGAEERDMQKSRISKLIKLL
eukprot:jgi/Mesen1/6369/ME000329S05538